jgi:four helix bundle protein
MRYVRQYRELRVYQLAFRAAMHIFDLSKDWPIEERYSLTDQIRRSSRSVCGQIAEAWRKRRYPAHFVSKLSDADGECAETTNWLDFALKCGYLAQDEHKELWATYDEVTHGLESMMNNAAAWCDQPQVVRETVLEYLANAEEVRGRGFGESAE